MTLQELQKQIYNGGISNNYIVFKCDKGKDGAVDTFLAYQYTNAIAKVKGLTIELIDDLTSLFSDNTDLFNDVPDNLLRVYYQEKFDCDNVKLNEQTNLIIITYDFTNDSVKDNCSYNTIKIPKLDSWQIKDYLYSSLKGVQKEKLDWIQDICGNNIYRIQQEIDRLSIFDETERDKYFDLFIRAGVYQDLSNINIFSLTNALSRGDVHNIKTSYPDIIRNKETTNMGFLSITLNAFKNMILVKTQENPTTENTKLKENQIKVLQRMGTRFTSQQMIDIFLFLSDIDRRVKTGEMWVDILIDYIIVKIMTTKERQKKVTTPETPKPVVVVDEQPKRQIIKTYEGEDPHKNLVMTEQMYDSLNVDNFGEITQSNSYKNRNECMKYLNINYDRYHFGYDELTNLLAKMDLNAIKVQYPKFYKDAILGEHEPSADYRYNIGLYYDLMSGWENEDTTKLAFNNYCQKNNLPYSMELAGIDKNRSLLKRIDDQNNIDLQLITPRGVVPVELMISYRFGENAIRWADAPQYNSEVAFRLDKLDRCHKCHALAIHIVYRRDWQHTRFMVIDTDTVIEGVNAREETIKNWGDKKAMIATVDPNNYLQYTKDNFAPAIIAVAEEKLNKKGT